MKQRRACNNLTSYDEVKNKGLLDAYYEEEYGVGFVAGNAMYGWSNTDTENFTIDIGAEAYVGIGLGVNVSFDVEYFIKRMLK